MTLTFFRREPAIDTDIALITDYLAEDLPAEQMESVRQRLGSDDAFFEKVLPLMQVWYDQVPDLVLPANAAGAAAAPAEHADIIEDRARRPETPWWVAAGRRLNAWWAPALVGFSIPILMLAIKNGDPAMRQPTGSAIRPPIISRSYIANDMVGGAQPLPYDVDAIIEVGPGRTLRLTTWPDPVFLESGRYDVECNPECSVGVERGRVRVILRGGDERYYGRGEVVRVPRDGATDLR